MNGLIIRPYRDGDAAQLGDVFHRAVREGAARKYSARQRAAWSPAPPEGAGWSARLGTPDTIVAERDGRAIGFMTVDLEAGYLDFAYVAPEVMGRGVADTLYAVIEGRARVAGLRRLETEASRVAEPFFLRRGWTLIARQKVECGGVKLPNARMAKTLVPTASDRAA